MVANFGEKKSMRTANTSARPMTAEQRRQQTSIYNAKYILKTADAEHLKSESLKARRQEIEEQLHARVAQLTGNVLR